MSPGELPSRVHDPAGVQGRASRSPALPAAGIRRVPTGADPP